MHERHVNKGHNGTQSTSGSSSTTSNNHHNQNGVRQRAVPLQCFNRGGGGALGSGGGGGDTTPTSAASALTSSLQAGGGGGLPPAPPLSQGGVVAAIGVHHHHVHGVVGSHRTHSAKIIDAFSHPAAAAAAVAAAGNNQQRGRKRKTFSMILLSFVCGAVVYYSGTMYTSDDFFADADSSARRHTSLGLRSSSSNNINHLSSGSSAQAGGGASSSGMDYQLSSFTSRLMQSSSIDNTIKNKNNNNEIDGVMLSRRNIVIRNRIINALKAAFVADAASMGTHWIYNTNELELRLNSKDEPEFRSPPVPKFYSSQEFPGHYLSGMASPYGEQLLFVTNFVATSMAKSGTSSASSSSRNHRHDGGGEPFEEYEEADDDDDQLVPDSIMEPMSAAMQTWATTFGGRADHASLNFLSCRRQRAQDGPLQELQQQPSRGNSNHNDDDGDSGEDEIHASCGADDDQAHFFIKVIPLTCLYVGHPQRRHYVEQAIRVHQNNENAVLLGLALSDFFERVLLMEYDDDNDNENSKTEGGENAQKNLRIIENAPNRPVKSLRDALDTTLTLLQEEQGGWFHFADAFTTHHQQEETLLESWIKAKKSAEKKRTIAQVAAAAGSSCHMPGALIVTLHALYRAANAEAKTPSASNNNNNKDAASTKKKTTTATTHYNMGYDYLVKTLLGIASTQSTTAATTAVREPREENPLLVAAVRGNILAAGDTCSRAILMGAVLGAAYGGPPQVWWEKLYPVLSGQVDEASSIIADHAVRRLHHKENRRRRRRHRRHY